MMMRLALAFLIGTVIAAFSVIDLWRNGRRHISQKYVLWERIGGAILMWGGFVIVIASLIVPGRRFLLPHGCLVGILGFVMLNVANLRAAVLERKDQPIDRSPSERENS